MVGMGVWILGGSKGERLFGEWALWVWSGLGGMGAFDGIWDMGCVILEAVLG